MYTENEILAKVVRASLLSKEAHPNPLQENKKNKIPSYHPLYKSSVEMEQDISVHAVKGVFPYKIFENRSPNQTQEEANYIEKTYKQTTLPVFMDYQSTVSRAFNDANWSISYGEDNDIYKTAGYTFKDYVENDIKTYNSVEQFVKGIIPSIKARDAMGVIVVKPYEIPTINNGEEDIIDSTVLLEPIPFYYKSSQVVDFEIDEFYLIELNEKSLVKYAGGDPKPIGKIYEFYDENAIYRITQVGEFTKNTFEIILYYQHNEDKVPVTQLKGIPKIEDNKILWQSPFLYAVDNLDLVAMNASNLQISITKCVYPYAILLGDECEFEDNNSGVKCVSGYLPNYENGTRSTCPSCNGSGLKSRMNAMGQMILKPQNRNDSGEFSTSQKAIEYVSPPVEALAFLESNIQKNEQRARSILHLNTNVESVKFSNENKTATGSNNNQKALYSFVKNISDQTFDIYQFILDRIGFQRYGNDYAGVNLIYPQTFDFLTDEDYLKQISDSIAAGLPPFVIHTILYKYLKAMYYSDSKSASAFNLIMATDRLLTLSNDDIALKMARGTVDKWEEILHTSAITFIDNLVNENPNFLSLPIEVQQNALVEKAKLTATEITDQNKELVKTILE